MQKIGLLFGSFNPIHNGHLMLANYLLEYAPFDEVWFVVSPQNPLKASNDLLPEARRLEWVQKAIGNFKRFKTCTIEFNLPKPSFTIDTLRALTKQHPLCRFVVLMGADSLSSLHLWKEYEAILSGFEILVYPRRGYEKQNFDPYPGLKQIDAPLIELSSTFIRKGLKTGKDLRFFMPKGIYQLVNQCIKKD